MGKFSTYRYLELKDDTSSSHINVRSRTIKQPRRLKKIFVLLIVLALCVMYFTGLFAGQRQWLDGIANSLGYKSEHHYAVVIDAGSSGSRVLAYKFRVPFTVFCQPNLDLVEEYFAQSKPGLSSYADDPEKGAETIVKLIKKAEFLTPPEKRKDTPLLIRATAGLRLLPQEKAQELVEHVSQATAKLGYDASSNAVEIMDGSDEGIFIWYTLNLLHNLLDGSETMAALDLGGGSTQITYQLSEAEAPLYPPQDKHTVAAPHNITLYTHSYLNLGLLAARYGIFRMEANNNETTTFTSVCVDPIVQGEKWVYGNKEYIVSGAPRPDAMKREQILARCQQLAARYVAAAMRAPPAAAPRAQAAMSYFYDVAADAGLVDVMHGGTVSVGSYRRAARAACAASNVEQPWACVDLAYVFALLHRGHGLPPERAVQLFKKVNGHEVSWALGLAYTTMMKRMAAAAAAA